MMEGRGDPFTVAKPKKSLVPCKIQDMQQKPRELGDGHKMNYIARSYVLAQQKEYSQIEGRMAFVIEVCWFICLYMHAIYSHNGC